MKIAKSLLPNDSFSFPGITQNLLEKIKDSAMLILSSDYEGLPNIIIEAMLMGIPVISTDCPSGGPRALIDDGQNGLLVPVGDPYALCNAMLRIAEDSDFSKMLVNNAKMAREKFNLQSVGKKWKDYLYAVYIKNKK